MDSQTRPTPSLLAHLDTRTWLERWSREAIEAGDAIALDVSDEMRTTGWLGSPPATVEQVRAAEAKLGRKLPPSLQEFYAVTNGWPVLSMAFDALRPVHELGWVRDLDPELVAIWSETESGDEPNAEEYHDGSPLLRRSLLLNTGTDHFLLDPARQIPNPHGDEPEWAAVGFTSWHPGAGEADWSFRAGLEDHYATFIRFDAPDSQTRQEVAEQVEHAYRGLLKGERSHADVLKEATKFGNDRARVLRTQAQILGQAHSGSSRISNLDLRVPEIADDPAVLEDLLPLLVYGSLGPGYENDRRALERTMELAPERCLNRLRELVATFRRGDDLRADFGYAPAFAKAVDEARSLAAAGRGEEAFGHIVRGLKHWRPLSGGHLAPMGLLWDHDLAPVMADRQRRRAVLETQRGR